jgi:transcriptional regulator with XRE-family HTH domain
MSSVRQNLIKKFRNRKYREGFVSSHLASNIAAQISLMRAGRSLSQDELAELAGMKQSRISLMENPSYEGFNINTLRRLAAALDVALIVRFVPYGELLGWAINLDEEQLNPASFDHDPTFKPAQVEAREGSALSAIHAVQQQAQGGASNWLADPLQPRENLVPMAWREAERTTVQ